MLINSCSSKPISLDAYIPKQTTLMSSVSAIPSDSLTNFKSPVSPSDMTIKSFFCSFLHANRRKEVCSAIPVKVPPDELTLKLEIEALAVASKGFTDSISPAE